jgi:hypothetical protein
MDKSLVLWIFGIIISIDTAFIIFLIKEYLNFRFHLAENYVLKKDHQGIIKAIFNKLDEISKCQQKILLELGKKAERQ